MTNNFEEFTKLLSEFVSFKSISTDPKFKGEIDNTVLWLKNILKESGFKTEIWKAKNTNPVVFASYKSPIAKETITIYGHYDVQPAELIDGWKGNPFVLRNTNKKLIGRGVVDNKGQILTHIFTAKQLIKEGKLKYNLKFLIEGNEETGNDDLAGLIRKNKEKISCDAFLISDGELTNNKPTIEVSLRGGFNCKITFKTGKNNLHSGIFGGAVPNATQEAVSFLSKLFDNNYEVKFREFYKGVDLITKSQLANNKKLTSEAADLAKLAGVKSLVGREKLDFYTITGLKPTIQITGFKSGYISEGFANIVPSEAEVRLNFRIVASQNPEVVAQDFEKFVRANVPEYVDLTFLFHGLHNPIKVNQDNPYLAGVEKTLEKVYGQKVGRKNVGGAIPLVSDVKNILNVDTMLIPLCNEDCNMHGTEENFDINLLKKALQFSRVFLGK